MANMGRIYKALTLRSNGKHTEIVGFVDTGSDTCIISRRIAKFLGIEPTGEEQILVANGETIDTILGEVIVESQIDGINSKIPVNITDAPFESDPDENVDMIIGLDFLQENNVTLKLHAKRLEGAS